MFDFAPVGGGIALCGILFMLLFGWKLVKVRKKTAGLEVLQEAFRLVKEASSQMDSSSAA